MSRAHGTRRVRRIVPHPPGNRPVPRPIAPLPLPAAPLPDRRTVKHSPSPAISRTGEKCGLGQREIGRPYTSHSVGLVVACGFIMVTSTHRGRDRRGQHEPLVTVWTSIRAVRRAGATGKHRLSRCAAAGVGQRRTGDDQAVRPYTSQIPTQRRPSSLPDS
jgi:hypothetical protein